jgi:hypothetical protein|nr:MAG: hypothetical protein DIU54_09325 [Acidobacteriota bacterium]
MNRRFSVFNRRVLSAAICGMLMVPAAAAAQGEAPLSQMLTRLIQSEIWLAPPPPGFPSHEAHFIPGEDQQLAPYLFNQQIVTQLATFPIGSSSGGFSFTFDPSLGVFQRASDTFGPAFAERALTNGRGRVTFGANYQRSSYGSFNGQSLDGGDITFYLRHIDSGGLFFEGDVVEAKLALDLDSTTTSFFVNYGVTDNFDIAVTVPIVNVSMDARVDARILRLATGEGSPIHSFEGGASSKTFPASGSRTGIGDILFRTKYRFVEAQGGGMAVGVDLRLPSGDAENLLGTGAAALTGTLIGSSVHGRLAPHFNASFTIAGEGDVVQTANEFGYKAGVEFAAAPTVTLVADLIGRTLLDVGRLQLADTVWRYTDSQGEQFSTTLREYERVSGSLNLVSLAVGGKFNVAADTLISANLLIALNDSGLVARVTPVVGLDFSF